MKKILLSIIFLLTALVGFPLSAHGSTTAMELTVTLDSLTMPTRSAPLGIGLTIEYFFGPGTTSRFVIVKDSDRTIVVSSAGVAADHRSSVTFGFNYDSASAPYSVHFEIPVNSSVTGKSCKIDCSNVTLDGTSWVGISPSLYYYTSPSSYAKAYCPASCACDIGMDKGTNYTAVSGNNVIVPGYWRSPALCTITSPTQCTSP